MARVVIPPLVREELEILIATRNLPPDTPRRVKEALRPLATFPQSGAKLRGHWSRFRFIPGPWRWMIVVYAHVPRTDEVVVISIQDGRAASAATNFEGKKR